MVSDWGGMTFLLPYVLFVVLIASTGVIEEMALGRAAKSGPIRAFGKCTEIRTGNKRTGEVIGVIPVIGSLALAIGYSVVVGWLFFLCSSPAGFERFESLRSAAVVATISNACKT